MARADTRNARELKFPTSKGRISSDSVKRSRARKDSRDASQVEIGGSWTSKDAGATPTHLDTDDSQAPSPFPELDDPLRSPRVYEHTPVSSTKITPHMTPSGSWNAATSNALDGLNCPSPKSKSAKPKVHIRPMLRKMSRDDAAPSTSVDLSRSSTDQEGLGIYMNMERDRRQSESLIGVPYRRTSSFHHRSTSGTSQYSAATGSSGGKPGSQYVYAMRPTPRANTPPLSQSHPPSGDESDSLEDGEAETKPKSSFEPPKFVRASSGPVPRLSLQIEDDSFTQLPGISQANVSRPSFGHSRDNGSTLDTASPISRNSLDYVFRSRTRTSTDPVSRAATVQAARQAFEEKEAAKTRRFEKQQLKSEARQSRRRSKRSSTGEQESPVRESQEKISESPKKQPNSKQADTEVHARQQPSSFKSQSKSTWVLFMTWLRTRLFKFRRKMRKR